MSKNIIFCADGTWNGPGEPDSEDKSAIATNVFKTFLNLDGRDTPETYLLEKEQERILYDADGTAVQVAKYLHGVGDSDNFLVKVLGGTVGAGLIARIVRGFTYVSRNYVPGDKIFLLGFSRGAYTARALAGLIAAKGLLDSTKLDLADKEETYRLGSAVWYQYRLSALGKDPDWLSRIAQMVLDLPGFFTRPPRADQVVACPIEAVAVWDTVGAFGIPTYTLAMKHLDLFQFADLSLSEVVHHGIHAIAVDEMREDFTPTLWEADARIKQVLFAGAHSDIGGGYPYDKDECGLSDGTLKWMTNELALLGVRFSATPTFLPEPDPIGPAHSPWAHPPWDVLARGARVFPHGLYLSQGVLDRIAAKNVIGDFGSSDAAAYKPLTLSEYITGGLAAAGVIILG